MKLDEIQALCDAATPGPWMAASDWDNYAVWSAAAKRDIVQSPSRVTVNNPCNEWTRERDAAFIAAARTLMPRLVAVARAAEAHRQATALIALPDAAHFTYQALYKALAALEAP